jgi:excisionase family DNA binding protein
MSSPKKQKLLTPREVADMLNIGLVTVYQWASAGRLPVIRLGGERPTLRFRPEDIERLIEDLKAPENSQFDATRTSTTDESPVSTHSSEGAGE